MSRRCDRHGHHGHGHFVDDGIFRERGRSHEVIYGRTIARPSKSRLFVRLHDAPPGPLSGVRSNKHACEKEEHIKCDHHKRDIASYRIVSSSSSSSSFKERRHVERKEKKTRPRRKHNTQKANTAFLLLLLLKRRGFSLFLPHRLAQVCLRVRAKLARLHVVYI